VRSLNGGEPVWAAIRLLLFETKLKKFGIIGSYMTCLTFQALSFKMVKALSFKMVITL
jgi:hypothetical protein